MGCNAWNHSPGCNCGWGGEGHSGGGGWYVVHEEKQHTPPKKRKKKTKKKVKVAQVTAKPKLQEKPKKKSQTNRHQLHYGIRSSIPLERRMSNCPKCGQAVYFIRHNGGSVWLDPPLSPPWYKHPCFDTQEAGKSQASTSLIDKASRNNHDKSIIVLIHACINYPSKKTTHLMANVHGDTCHTIVINGNAQEYLGELCLYDQESQRLHPLKSGRIKAKKVVAYFNKSVSISALDRYPRLDPELEKKIRPNSSQNYKAEPASLPQEEDCRIKNKAKILRCHICRENIWNDEELVKHLAEIHNCAMIVSRNLNTGVMILKKRSMRPLDSRNDEQVISPMTHFLFKHAIERNGNTKSIHECTKAMSDYIEKLIFYIYADLNEHYDNWVSIEQIFKCLPQLDPTAYEKIPNIKMLTAVISLSERFVIQNFYHNLKTPYGCIREINL